MMVNICTTYLTLTSEHYCVPLKVSSNLFFIENTVRIIENQFLSLSSSLKIHLFGYFSQK